ncbi:MAG: methylated-DNA--[protein]-cysteine S-methyltransferase [Lachnospiraceae bacterium]|nr:methylated-DNA--[protein]-cysteine S-methyltransferase [Lachnospiraceae bacterium]
MKHKGYYKSPLGMICIEEKEGSIAGLYFVKSIDEKETTENETIEEAKRQLEEYFSGRRREFTLPVRLEGTDFQVKVWRALQTIPYGETRSYGDIAKQIGNPKAARAIGNANNKNHILLLVPCHRVIGADGSLVGFGSGLDVKKYLLELEKVR